MQSSSAFIALYDTHTRLASPKQTNIWIYEVYGWFPDIPRDTLPLTYARQQHIINMRDNRGAHELGRDPTDHQVLWLDAQSSEKKTRFALPVRRQATKGEAAQNEMALHWSSKQDRWNERGANYREGQQLLGVIPQNDFSPPKLWRVRGGP